MVSARRSQRRRRVYRIYRFHNTLLICIAAVNAFSIKLGFIGVFSLNIEGFDRLRCALVW